MWRGVIVRGVASIAIGVLLVAMRESFMPFLVQCVGVAFMLPGLFVLAALLYGLFKHNVKAPSPMVLLSGVGSVLFGLWLLLNPYFFVAIFMYILGTLLLLLGIWQTLAVLSTRRKVMLPLYMIIVPLLLVVVGVVVIVKPFGIASLPFLLLGIAAIIGGISDILNFIIVNRKLHSVEMIEVIEKQ